MSHDVTGPGPTPEPDPHRLRKTWHNASPYWHMQLPPYDPDSELVELPPLDDAHGGS